MRLPFSWLKEYINCELSPTALADTLTFSGLEVEKIEGDYPHSLCRVVVGEVRGLSPHPHDPKLAIAQVDDGEKGVQVVCGDRTLYSGNKVALAKIGSSLPDGKGGVRAVKRVEMLGIPSSGELCSERALGLGEKSEKIARFPDKTPVGADVIPLIADPIFTLSITPNLGHCMSVLGIARDVGAFLNLRAKRPAIKKWQAAEGVSERIDVEIEEGEKCNRYCCRLIENVQIAPSPHWIKKRLEQSEMHSIDNVIDVSNFVMLEMGQPLHAFDYDKIEGKALAIRATQQELPFTTLDGKRRTIPKGTLMIWGGADPVAIAGIMGGADTAVRESTSRILLESAHFSPAIIRRGSKNLGLRTESSTRFERGIDFQGIPTALDRATDLICRLTGGSCKRGKIDCISQPFSPRTITCRTSRINQILGTDLETEMVRNFFQRLEMDSQPLDRNTLCVEIPSYRNDIRAEIDLIEESARIYGYDKIAKKREKHSLSPLPHSPLFLLEREVRKRAIAEGLWECLTCDLIDPQLLTNLEGPGEAISVLHPKSINQSALRTSLLPGLLQAVKKNFAQQNRSISAFEIGRIHWKNRKQLGEEFREWPLIAIVLTGCRTPHHWEEREREVDFFDLKGKIENILSGLAIPHISFSPSHHANFHPQKQAEIFAKSTKIGILGEVHPLFLEACDIKERVFFGEIELSHLLALRREKRGVSPLPLYPGSDRDWTITVSRALPCSAITEAIEKAKSPLLKKISVLDLYRGEELGSDRQNITFRLSYRDEKGTVEQKQVDEEHTRIIAITLQAIQKERPDFLDLPPRNDMLYLGKNSIETQNE